MSHAIVTDPCLSTEVLQQVEECIMFYKGIYLYLGQILNAFDLWLSIYPILDIKITPPYTFRSEKDRQIQRQLQQRYIVHYENGPYVIAEVSS